jgi:hypothetical protein
MKTSILNYIILFSISICMYSCQDKDQLFYGTGTIQGYAYIKESGDSSLPIIAKNLTIFLNEEEGTTSSFNYSTKTDSNGFFKIEFLNKGSYTLFSSFTKNNIKYFKSINVCLSEGMNMETAITLAPDPTNSITLQFVDASNTNNVVGKLPFRLYNNLNAALLDSSSIAFKTDVSNDDGFKTYNNIYPNLYYVVSKTYYATYTAVVFDTVRITSNYNNTKIIKVTLSAPVSPNNKTTLNFKDIANPTNPIFNLNFRLYTSSLAAHLDIAAQAVKNGTSDINGMFVFNNLFPNKYYIVAKQAYGIYSAVVFDSVTVNATGVVTKDINVALVAPAINNTLQINLKDTLNGSIGNFPFWFYTSAIAAQVNDTIHSYKKVKSNNNGIYTEANLNPNMYFIVARDSFANILLKAYDTLTVPLQGNITRTITLRK